MPLQASPSARRRALMLVNPNARRGGEALDPVIARLEAGGIAVRIERFGSPEEAAADIVRRREDADFVIVCGGDGTINAASRGILATGLPMAILPMGTANDLARTLGIPFDLEGAADVIVRGETRVIDLGEVNGRPFFNVATIGLGADLASGLDARTKKRWGRLGYAISALKVLSSAKPFTATLVDDRKMTTVKTYQIAVGNGVHYGGGTVIEADAAIDDGELDLYSLELGNVWKLALMIFAFRRGTHGAWEEVRTDKAMEFDIRTRRPRDVNCDGDIVTQTPAHFRVLPGAIRVLAPPQA